MTETGKALRKIEEQLSALADEGEWIDPFDLRHFATLIGAQAEMLEQGLAQ